MSTQEFWKPVLGYEGIYEVSDQGRVKRIARRQGNRVYPEMFLNPQDPKGTRYKQVTLCKNGGKRKTVFIHTLVLEAFVGKRKKGHVARHINGDRLDCTLVNLQWGTHAQNSLDSIGHGTHVAFQRRHLNEQQAKSVLMMRRRGEKNKDIAEHFGVKPHVISDILRGKSYGGKYSAQ